MFELWKNKYATLSEPKELFTVLIAAAGSGQRMGGVYKPLTPLNGRPMIAYSLEAFQTCGFVKRIVVSAPDEHAPDIRKVAEEAGCTKLVCIVPGGKTRAESVKCAFRAAFPDKNAVTPFLAVHDAARPLITDKQLCEVFFACVRHGAAVALPRCATRSNMPGSTALLPTRSNGTAFGRSKRRRRSIPISSTRRLRPSRPRRPPYWWTMGRSSCVPAFG